ncbi:hypothetical protein OMP38_22670 [Cohnella ginsengisoli]|uniref:Fibronectin type-III domain-containing protein n=1 Tax=Cohnella ginsengisoli TaxID=425004 RepID=A0A9X4KP98_9BACL|nr:hypothetical protein [Cohnella ginsengisoli]MDG0793335.1 hypothetical protein [Cohnella ginsengisoli]
MFRSRSIPIGGNAPGSKGYTEFAFGLSDDGRPLAYRYNAIGGQSAGAYAAGQLSITRNESTKLTNYEIAIPWNEIVPAGIPIGDGSSLGISVLANYSDGSRSNPASGDARNGWIEYNSGIGAGKAPGLFGYFILSHHPLAAPAIRGTAMTGGKVSLAWTEAAGATGYTLKYGTASRNYTDTVELGDTTSLEVEGLSIGTTYYFAIESYDAYGVSELSDELLLTPLADEVAVPSGAQGNIRPPDPTTANIPVSAIGDKPLMLEVGQATIILSPSLLKTLRAQSERLEGGDHRITGSYRFRFDEAKHSRLRWPGHPTTCKSNNRYPSKPDRL